MVITTSMLVAAPAAVGAQTAVADAPLRTVSVSGLGQTSVEPDQAIVRVGANIVYEVG